MKLILIAAVGKNRVIGKNEKIPWHIPQDLHKFRQLTVGHTVLMGRKTFEAIGKPLDGRRNVVVTSKKIPGVETFSSLEQALLAVANEEKVFVIGGGQIYSQLLEQADELCLTLVDQNVDGDTFFPPYERLIESSFTLASEKKHEGFRLLHYIRANINPSRSAHNAC
jgi:dihydrofolate reductase